MSSDKNWDLQINPAVFKTLEQFPHPAAEIITRIIKFLPADPHYGDIQKMKGEENVWRRRIGAYRLFYKIMTRERVVLVFRLERRTSKTY